MSALTGEVKSRPSLLLSEGASKQMKVLSFLGESLLFLIAASSLLAVLFIILFILKDALPFFWNDHSTVWERFKEFFTEEKLFPAAEPPVFGCLNLFYGTFVVTVGATFMAVPIGICAAFCLSDLLPFSVRQWVKPVIEVLASIPSVAFGFFALVILAPMLQSEGGFLLNLTTWLIAGPIAMILAWVLGDIFAGLLPAQPTRIVRIVAIGLLLAIFGILIWLLASWLGTTDIKSGANALNASFMLGLMALPTIVSVSEDALQSAGIELRMASYGLGATRAETMLRTVLPAASSGIMAAVILGIMRAVGETMVVLMAAGGGKLMPDPLWDITQPVRTLTAAIAGDMGEAPRGSDRYFVLFAMALSLLVFCFIMNLVSEWAMKRNRQKLRGEI